MEERIKEKLRKMHDKDERAYFDAAVESILDKSELERKIVNHYVSIDESELFSDDISGTIKYLTKLKENGYVSISQHWSGYEDNYFIADKFELETDDEYIFRLDCIISKEIETLIKKNEDIRKDEEEIRKLEERIKQIKSKSRK